jgi:hypothetical protein
VIDQELVNGHWVETGRHSYYDEQEPRYYRVIEHVYDTDVEPYRFYEEINYEQWLEESGRGYADYEGNP